MLPSSGSQRHYRQCDECGLRDKPTDNRKIKALALKLNTFAGKKVILPEK